MHQPHRELVTRQITVSRSYLVLFIQGVRPLQIRHRSVNARTLTEGIGIAGSDRLVSGFCFVIGDGVIGKALRIFAGHV